LKLCLYSTVAYLVIRGILKTDIASITDGRGLSELMERSMFRLLLAFVLLAVIFAVVDQLIVRRDFLKRMRMSRRELRREAREREGEPRLKQKRKHLHAELAKTSQSLKNLRKADMLIVNPQHIAIALHYDRRTMLAPVIISAGTDQLAQRLRRLAFIYGIPVVENRTLARELYYKSALNRPIPEQCFAPVANIYNSIWRKSGKGGADRDHVQTISGQEF
jgi:flagellar biosynthetic protein FlhB